MPIDKRVSLADAFEGVSDGTTVFITGFGGAGTGHDECEGVS